MSARVFIGALVLLLGALSVHGADSADGNNEVVKKTPPDNSWGSYLNLPDQRQDMERAFTDAFDTYQANPTRETKCQASDAEFERWFKNLDKPNEYILSYYCKSKAVRGYEHLHVQLQGTTFKKVINFGGSLKDFKIMDAGEYGKGISDKEGQDIVSDMLPKITEQIGIQKNPYNKDLEMCPNPSNQTMLSVQAKQENGLYYYRMAISCNIFNEHGYGADFMTNIEVAYDKDFKKVNKGEPYLIYIEMPKQNIDFIKLKQQEELAAMKQS